MTDVEPIILPNHPVNRARLMQENMNNGWGSVPGMMQHEEGAIMQRPDGHVSRAPLRHHPSRPYTPPRVAVTKANVQPIWWALGLTVGGALGLALAVGHA